MLVLTDQVVIPFWQIVVSAVPPTLLALATLVKAIKTGNKVDSVKTLVNGRMDQMLKEAIDKAYHQGHVSGTRETLEKIKEIPPAGIQQVFDSQILGKEVTIRDRETGHVISRRASNDPEVLDALNDPDRIVE